MKTFKEFLNENTTKVIKDTKKHRVEIFSNSYDNSYEVLSSYLDYYDGWVEGRFKTFDVDEAEKVANDEAKKKWLTKQIQSGKEIKPPKKSVSPKKKSISYVQPNMTRGGRYS